MIISDRQDESMNFIVLDLEWNQSPSGKEDSIEHLPFEIIEIGAVRLDENRNQVSQFHRLIRPQAYKQMHYKISEVTHMSMEELEDQGETFPQAAARFLEWCGKDYVFCTWGSMDLTELQRNMDYYHVVNPFPRPLLYYDVQKLYCLEYGDGKNKLSLDQAVQEMGIQVREPFHRALDDADYTGKILSAMDFEAVRPYISVDYYRPPASRKEELHLRFPSYSKYVSRTFDSREEALKDKEVGDILCPCCNRMLRKKIRWFPWSQRLCLGLGLCPDHGWVRGKIRVKKEEYGQVYIVKTMRLATEEEAAILQDKKEELRRKRNARTHMKQKKSLGERRKR